MLNSITRNFIKLSLILSSAPLVAEPHALDGRAQGSTWHVLYGGKLQPDLQSAIDQELAAFDKVFSNYRPDSDISRFNEQTSTDWFAVDSDLVKLVQLSETVSEKSEGAFDITIGPLLKIWGFGPFKSKEHRIPTDAMIAEAQKSVDYRKLKFRSKPPALKKLLPALYVDLSGVAQGYSVDRIAALLDKRGTPNYMVEIGGEVKTKGQKLPGKPWTLGVDAPTQNAGEVAALLHMEGKALSGLL